MLFRGPNCCEQSDLPGAHAEENASPLRSGADPENSIGPLRPQQCCPQRCSSKNGDFSMGITTLMRELIDG